jgi:hypothetical protein
MATEKLGDDLVSLVLHHASIGEPPADQRNIASALSEVIDDRTDAVSAAA